MRSAIYIENGLMQIVLTAEDDLEKAVINKLKELDGVESYGGRFYECRGGWIREGQEETSTIFVLRKEKEVSIAK